MRALIRCDIGGPHGMGHASRCLALARALAQREVTCVFVTQTPALRDYVAPFGCLDLHDSAASDSLHPGDVYIFDHLTDIPSWSWRMKLRADGYTLVCIDPSEPPDDAWSLVVVPNMHASVADYRQSTPYAFMAGAASVMLPQDVSASPPMPYRMREEEPIVLCAGGSDPGDVLEQLWDWSQAILPNVMKWYLVGQQNQSKVLHKKIKQGRGVIPFDRDYLRKAALVVTTFGQVVYECLWWHTPVLVIGHTDQHCAAAKSLLEAVAYNAHYLGDIRTMDASAFRALVNAYYTAQKTRASMSVMSIGLLDGRGVGRIAEAILELV